MRFSFLRRHFFHPTPTKILVWSFFSFWICYFAYFWSHAIFMDEQGNLVAGHVNIWGDWAAHFTMTMALSQRGIFIKSPFLLNATFNYPFFADLISAALLRLHIPFLLSFLLPSFLFSVFFVWALYFFYKTFWDSTKLALLSCMIFLLNGGMGFLFFIQDILASKNPLQTLINPLHEYTRIDVLGIKWISIIDSMMIPQRAFLVGFPIALVALTAVLHFSRISSKKHLQRLPFFVIGLVVGTLPIIHTHSFLALFIIFSNWSVLNVVTQWPKNRRAWQKWCALAIGASLIGVPLLWHFVLSTIGQHFFQWNPGWLAHDFQMNWFVFWWRNWGITPLVAVAGWILLWEKAYKKSKKHTQSPLLFLPFFLLFILINLFLFQPFVWDNTKLLAWASVGISGLAAYAVAEIWCFGKGHTFYTKFALRFLAGILFVIMIFSGAIDTYRIIRFSLHSYTMYSAEELQLADWVDQHTPVNSIWLTSDQHNHWLYNLTGRQAVMAYRGWLWTYGYDYVPTEVAVRAMFAGGIEAQQLLHQYGIQYIVVGPSERKDYHANEIFLDQHFPVIYRVGQTKIYQVVGDTTSQP